MTINLIELLPNAFREFREYQSIFNDCEQPKFDELNNETLIALNNQFVDSLNPWACSKWEKMGKLPTNTDISVRRANIKSMLMEKRPYNIAAIKNKLNAIYGEGNYTIENCNCPYKFYIGIYYDESLSLQSANDLLNRWLPANIMYFVYWVKAKHSDLGEKTHGDLGAYTYQQIEMKVFE